MPIFFKPDVTISETSVIITLKHGKFKGDIMQKLRNKNKEGFTLIELMIVIAIIGILAAISTISYLYYLSYARDKTAAFYARSAYRQAMSFCIVEASCAEITDVTELGFTYPTPPEIIAEINADESMFITSAHTLGTKKYFVSSEGYLSYEYQ